MIVSEIIVMFRASGEAGDWQNESACSGVLLGERSTVKDLLQVELWLFESTAIFCTWYSVQWYLVTQDTGE